MKLSISLLPLLTTVLAHNPSDLSSSSLHHLNHARSFCSRSIHCILASEATEGPYYIPHPLIRSNITEDRPGIPLTLQVHVVDVANCAPAEGAWVDIWHADATGQYSGWAQDTLLLATEAPPSSSLQSRGGPPGGPHGGPPGFGGPGMHNDPKDESRWLRGVAQADSQGLVTFDTVMPAWYDGRSTHIHIRIHNGNVSGEHGQLVGEGNVAHTGQLFFADALVKKVATMKEPYITHAKTLKPKLNGDDGIFVNSGGAEQVVDMEEGEYAFVGSVTVGIDPSASHNGEESGGPLGGPGGWWKMAGLVVLVGLAVTLVGFGVKMYIWKRRSEGYIALQQGEEAEWAESAEAGYRDAE